MKFRIWPTCAPILRDVIKSPETTCEPGARNKQAFTLNGGCGTHVDAPAHFIPDGRTVEELTSEELVNVPLVVVDVSAKVAADADYRCTRADVVADDLRELRVRVQEGHDRLRGPEAAQALEPVPANLS